MGQVYRYAHTYARDKNIKTLDKRMISIRKTLDKTLDNVGQRWTTLDKMLIFVFILLLEASKTAAARHLFRAWGAISGV